MNIKINHQDFVLDDNSTLVKIIEQQQLGSAKGIAIAVNNKVIPKNNWDNYSLQNDDSVVIIRATQGG